MVGNAEEVTFTICLQFESEPGDEPQSVRGRVVSSSGSERPFTGWLQLLAELEDVVRVLDSAPKAHRESRGL